MGYVRREARVEPPKAPIERAPARAERVRIDRRPLARVPLWQPVKVVFRDEEADTEATQPLTREELTRPPRATRAPESPPLLPWSRLAPLLGRRIQQVRRAGLDCDQIVRSFARREVLRELPFSTRCVWPQRPLVIIDRSDRLMPFWNDQDDVLRRLRSVCTTIDTRVLPEGLEGPVLREGVVLRRRFEDVSPLQAVLALSDLGGYASWAERAAWLRLGRQLRRSGINTMALVPCPSDRGAPVTNEAWDATLWDRPAAAPEDVATTDRPAGGLVDLLCAAVRVEPGLMRALRLCLPSWSADVGTELEAWLEAAEGNATAMALSSDRRSMARASFFRVDLDTRRRVAALLRKWHACLTREVWYEEVLWLARTEEEAKELNVVDDWCEAVAFVRRLPATIRAGRLGRGAASRFLNYCDRFAGRGPAESEESELASAASAVRRGVRQRRQGKSGVDPIAPRWIVLDQVGMRMEVDAQSRSDDRGGSPIASFRVGGTFRLHQDSTYEDVILGSGSVASWHVDDIRDVRLDSAYSTLSLRAFTKPDWAVAAGRDRFGLWAEAETEGVRHRYRWIPPGRFWMGSPEDEDGRDDDEGPRHQVTISRGFWLGEVPCTQALYEAVIGSNPSEFKSPKRPVEQVSWDDANAFLEQANAKVDQLDLRLPTEAEWEYACRAGSVGGTYVGELVIRGNRNGPILDEIAWYGGNSGVEFDLERGYDTSDWAEKQYPHTRAGSRIVKLKRPNPWGLYDMLGNVFEWCADSAFRPYASEPATDPRFEEAGGGRVVRGGSWFSVARGCRAAYRDAYSPDDRHVHLGFRLARGP